MYFFNGNDKFNGNRKWLGFFNGNDKFNGNGKWLGFSMAMTSSMAMANGLVVLFQWQ
ncbi:MAG: hypothetical protein R2828_23185 [Saprospiraceae bacterium]